VRAAARGHVEALLAKAVEAVRATAKNKDPAAAVEVRGGGGAVGGVDWRACWVCVEKGG
jgi:hypothetical protein